MSLGSRTRRIAPGFASVIVISLAMAGCQAVPFTRLTTASNRPQSALAVASRAALMPATVALDEPAEMSSIEPTGAGTGVLEPSPNLYDPSKTPLTEFRPDPPPTPLLDAALQRVKNPSGREPLKFPELPTLLPTPAETMAPSIAIPVSPSQPALFPEPPRDKVARPEEPARPEDLWRDGVRKLVALARGRSDQAGGTPSALWSLRARVLAWLAEPDIDPDLGQHDADSVRSVLKVLDESAPESPNRGEDVRAAVQAIENKAPLEMLDLKLCSRVDGYCDFVPFDPPVHKAGQSVVIYCELDGVQHEPTSAGYRSRLAGQVEFLPARGGPAVMVRALLTAEETCKRRRRDYYIAYKLILPDAKSLPPGDYKLRLSERDLVSDRSASREVAFAISKD